MTGAADKQNKSSRQLEIFVNYDTEVRNSFREGQKLRWQTFRNSLVDDLIQSWKNDHSYHSQSKEAERGDGQLNSLGSFQVENHSLQSPCLQLYLRRAILKRGSGWGSGTEIPRRPAPKSHKDILLSSFLQDTYILLIQM